MSEQSEGPENLEVNNTKIRILQINLNKSRKVHLDLVNEDLSKNYDIILIQEPHITQFNTIWTPTNFRKVIPPKRDQTQVQLIIWVNGRLDTKDQESKLVTWQLCHVTVCCCTIVGIGVQRYIGV
jgi:hypothetical protein